MIIVIGCNKGGAGKTTVATNLAVALAESGADVCLVDADQQSSASQWHAAREKDQREPSLVLVQMENYIDSGLKKLRSKFDHLVVDVPGRSSLELLSSMRAADLLIAPHQCSHLDLDTLDMLGKQLKQVRVNNRRLTARAYQTMASTNPMVKDYERAEFLTSLEKFEPQLRPMVSVNYYRKAYRDVISEGLSVIEHDNDQAAGEVRALMMEVLG